MFRDLCESASDLIQSVSADQRILYANKAWLRTLGYQREDLAHLHLEDIVHPSSRERCHEALKQLLSGRALRGLEVDFVTREGRRVKVIGDVNLRAGEGPRATVGIFRDVTARSDAQEQLDQLFNLSMDLLCVAGTDGYFKRINPAFEKVLKYSREELLSRKFIEFVHPDDRESTLREVERLAKGLLVVDFQNRYRDRHGAYHWLAWRSTPLAEQGLIYATARDITDQKRTQEDLARSNADLEQFAYVASHDLRAPLRNITTLAEWIEEDMAGELPVKVREHLENLKDRVRRMERLTEDLLQYSRLGRSSGEVQQVDTAEMIADLASLITPPTGFSITAEPPMPVLMTVRAPLEQVMRNLIGNAVKHHHRSHGKVTVRCREAGDYYEFSVADDGPGIPEQFREQVFQMFQKLRSHDEVEGTGMGLAIVRRIVESQGGRIQARETEGGGTTITFTWPRRAVPGEAA